MPMHKHPPTPEQTKAVELFMTGGSLKINAFAGTGKTTTLEYLAESTDRRGIYLAFNKSIAEDASKRFTPNVNCQTTHSLAYRATPSAYKNSKSKMSDELNPNGIAELLSLDDLVIGSIFSLPKRLLGSLVKRTLKRFQYSGDASLTESHVSILGKMMLLPRAERHYLIESVLLLAIELWDKMLDPADPAPLGHDGYLKRWTLTNPQISGDFILLDEAQDTNPAMLSALRRQAAQIVYVGDRFQQIYEWRDAVNAMDKVPTQNQCVLTQSFRFGAAIADAASNLLKELKAEERIIGNSHKPSGLGCGRPDVILCRTNAGVIDYVIQAFAAKNPPHIVGGTSGTLKLLEGVSTLKAGRPTDVPEFFGFQNWHELVEFSETEEGQHERAFVKLVNRYGEDKLKSYLSETIQQEEAASLKISTVHKAKGREWNNVVVIDDFSVIQKDKEGKDVVNESELRLLYVALTRARQRVQIPVDLARHFGIQQNFQPLDLSSPKPPPPLPLPPCSPSTLLPTSTDRYISGMLVRNGEYVVTGEYHPWLKQKKSIAHEIYQAVVACGKWSTDEASSFEQRQIALRMALACIFICDNLKEGNKQRRVYRLCEGAEVAFSVLEAL